MGTWAVWGLKADKSNGQVGSSFVSTYLYAAVLAVLLVIGGVEQNPGPGVEGERFFAIYV